MKALDLFCGAGGAARGLHRAGFGVFGVDIKPQPRFPFHFIEQDVMWAGSRIIAEGGFDLIWASPPCQAYTNAQRIRGNGHPDLIEPTRAMLKASGVPYVIENVPGAPLINPVELCGAMFGLRTYRHRLFEASFPIAAPPHPKHTARTAKMGRPAKADEFIHVVGNFSGIKRARDAMEIDWMTRDEIREAIPPAYSEYIAREFLKVHSSRPQQQVAEALTRAA